MLVLGPSARGSLSATAVFIGSTLSYLAVGTGRLDPRSRTSSSSRAATCGSASTLAALFALVVTGLVPGIVIGLVWSLLRDARSGAPTGAASSSPPRMPATLLMTLISIGGVAIGVWALTVVLSVMSGFEADLKRKILGQNAHGMLLTYGQNELTDWRGTRDRVLAVPASSARHRSSTTR